MPNFGKNSKKILLTCDAQLIRVFSKVIKYVDCSVTEGHRGKELQNKYFKEGKSKAEFPKGKHNNMPSKAIDVVPYPVDWKDIKRQHMFAGFVLGVAKSMGVRMRWGGCWQNDFDPANNKPDFYDSPHFELLD